MIGRTILHYTITAELGAGAMGRVYLAKDERTGRRVALKFPSAEFARVPEARERLVREAQAAARLSHPGVVTLHGLEEADGQLFLVEEFVEGESLARRLERGPLGAQETLRLAREIAAALAHAHAHGVLHRDLKPDNILIAGDGTYKIADFGIARLQGVSTMTPTGTVMGATPYLPPERLRGMAGDARADLYGLGAILYEAMAGRRAFAGTSEPEVLYAVMNEPPPPLEVSGPSLAPLADLALRLLAKEPAQRPASAAVVAGMIEGMQATSAVRPRVARRAAWWVPIAAAGVLVALGAGLVWLRGRGVGDAGGPPAVAVLYFENVADPADPGRMGSITGNLLITSLAQAAELNVLSTQRILDAMRQLGRQGGAVDRGVALEVAKRAHARRIVSGSILQISPSIVMTAEVSDVASGKVLNATRVEGLPGQTVFQVVDALSAQLLRRMVRAAETTRLAPVAERTSPDLEAQRSYAAGLEALSGARIVDAMAAFRQAVERDSSFAQAHYQLAIAEWWGGEPADAKDSILKAKALAGRLTPLERGMVQALENLVYSRYSAASREFAELAGEDPNEKMFAYGQVEALYHGGRLPEAVEAARRALALDPGFTLAGVHLVDALIDMNRLDEAEVEARGLLRRNPKNALLWLSLWRAMVRRGDPEGALRVASEARAMNAAEFPLRVASGTLLFNRTGTIEPGAWPAEADTLPWQKEEKRLGIRYVQALRRGRFREALRVAPEAWRNLPATVSWGPPIPAANGLEAATGARDTAQALRWADSIGVRLERWAGPGFPLLGRAPTIWAESRLGMYSQAAATLSRVASLSGGLNEYEAHSMSYCRALVLEGEGRHRESLEALRGAEWPGEPWLFSALRLARVRALTGAGMHSEALALLDTLIRMPMLHPGDAVRLRFYRGQALERLGRGADAAAEYREFLRIWSQADPGTPEVDEARAALRRIHQAALKVEPGGR